MGRSRSPRGFGGRGKVEGIQEGRDGAWGGTQLGRLFGC